MDSLNGGAISGAISVQKALVATGIMGAVIFFCRAFPFLLFRTKEKNGAMRNNSPFAALLTFVEKVAPPVAMTALAFNALAAPVKDAVLESPGIAGVLAACAPLVAGAGFTAVSYVWKRNTLISIFGGTILYMAIRNITG
ncbi:MAG: AzlD domain-containing protein [Treponema sp.]|jgi:branched-subunit amino acid transport protein AzlD|nr:AzlD domain-containing protein [Treponema sp.]